MKEHSVGQIVSLMVSHVEVPVRILGSHLVHANARHVDVAEPENQSAKDIRLPSLYHYHLEALEIVS
jgi:hypothetical protein